MLRLFYLLLVTTVMLAPYGCTASTWWLAGDSDDHDVGSLRDLRAGSTIESGDSATGAEPGTTPGKSTAQATDHNAIIEATLAGPAADQDSARTGRAGPDAAAARSPASGQMTDSPNLRTDKATADSLVEEVNALGFEDPHEEASALAALRAAPPEHRKFLLRTMQASAAVRKQHERRASSTSDELTVESKARSNETDTSVGRLSARQPLNRFARSLAASSVGTALQDSSDDSEIALAAQQRREHEVQQRAVAAMELEQPERLPRGVHPVSHSDELPTGLAQQHFDTLQADPIVNSPGTAGAAWRSHLDRAIAALEAELAGGAAVTDRATLEAKLRLLCLTAGRRDDAFRSRSASSAAEQEFWSNEIYGLATLWDGAKHPDAKQRAALAAPHLRQAAERLGEFGGLVVKNLHFCTEVKGYGSFVTFPQDEFRLGQEVLLYCEVENFQSELRDKGYHTALKGRYELFDSSGERVAEKDLGLKDEHCQNRRRDFFVPYFILMPKQVPPGKYRLKLTLEDVHAGQTAEATIEFAIKGK